VLRPALAAALLLLGGPAGRAAEDGDAEKAAAALKRLPAPGAGPERRRQDLQVFRRAWPGTPAAVEAARLLTELPSPLDRLSAASVPALERFDWQPKELVAVVGEHRGRHGGYVHCVAYSSDGKTVVSGGTGLTRLWDAATLRLRATLPYLGAGPILGLSLSRDGRTLAVGGGPGVVQVWDVSNRDKPTLRFPIPVATNAVQGVALRPDGKVLAAGCADGSLHLYDIAGEEPKSLAVERAHRFGVTSLLYAPDGKTLASGGADNFIRLWAYEDGQVKRRAALEPNGNTVLALAFTADGKTLASGDKNGNIYLWNVPPVGARPKPRGVIWGKGGYVFALSFSNTGNTIASACGDGVARLWTISGGRVYERARLEGHDGSVFGIAYAPDNRSLVTGGADWTVRSWDLAGKPKERFAPWGHLSHVYAADFAPDGKTLVSGSEDKTARLWDLTRPPTRPRLTFKGDSSPVHALAYAPDGRTVAAGVHSGAVRQFDPSTGREATALKGHLAPVTAVAWLPDGRQMLAMAGKTLFLWDAGRGEKLRRLQGHETNLTCVALSPDGRRALSGSGAALVENGKPVVRDGKPVYTDCVLRLWDVPQGKELHVEKAATPWSAATFSADGREFFTAVREPRLRRWGLGEGAPAERQVLQGEVYHALRMLATPDGRRLVTHGLDGRLIVWDLTTGARLKDWALPEIVDGIAVAPDGRHLAVCLGTGVVYVLRMAEGPAGAKK
jgi:WD40 repeat protein